MSAGKSRIILWLILTGQIRRMWKLLVPGRFLNSHDLEYLESCNVTKVLLPVSLAHESPWYNIEVS